MASSSISIKDFAMLIPKGIRDESGKVFYSGCDAFAKVSPLYVPRVSLPAKRGWALSLAS